MSILTTCPACDASYKVKDSLRGKRIRCRKCQATVRVADEDVGEAAELSTLETNPDIDVWDETQDEVPLQRWKADSADHAVAVPFSQRWLAHTARSPWVGLGLLFFGGWLPFSYLEPRFVLVMNYIFLALSLAGSVTGVVLDRLNISFPNPWDVLNQATLGGLAARGVPAESLVHTELSELSSGRRMSRQFLIMAAFFLGHAALLWLLKSQPVL
jgi:predicted Zn finger-like uncharacterized protein